MDPVARRQITDEVYRSLQRSIVDGRLAPGRELRLESIATELAVSRTPVREALRRLEAEGLVAFSPHRSVIVTPLTASGVEESYILRLLVESFTIRLAVPLMSPQQVAELNHLNQEMRLAHSTGDMEAVYSRHNEFHSLLRQPVKAAQLLEMCERLSSQTDRYRRVLNTYEPGRPVNAQREHAAIVAACRAGDADQAAILLATHLKGTADGLIRRLDPKYSAAQLELTYAYVTGANTNHKQRTRNRG